MRKDNIQWLIPIVLAIAAAVALWFYWVATKRETLPVETAPQEAAAPPAAAVSSPEPVHPLPEPPDAETDRPAPRPLPPLDQSDEYLKLSLADLLGESAAALLVEERLIERIAVTLDNLPREHVAERMRPMVGVAGPFLVDSQDDSGEFRLSPENYRRYDALVAIVGATAMSDVADLYRHFYPLLQEAYVTLGYPDGYFNDRVVEVIDDLLATPELSASPTLVRPNVLYEYADPKLEELSSGQKVLIRMGPDHSATIKSKLEELRALIVR